MLTAAVDVLVFASVDFHPKVSCTSSGRAAAAGRAVRLTKAEVRAFFKERFPRDCCRQSVQDYEDFIDDLMRGIDFSKPVESVTLRAGDVVDVWVRDGKTAGPWGASPGTSPKDLGITIDSATGLPKGRHLESYVLKDDVTVLRSTAGDYPAGLHQDVGGFGGGTQYVFPSDIGQAGTRIR